MKGLVRSLRCRLLSRLGDAALWLSSYQARRRLANATPLHIMVDNSILGNAITHETAWISTGERSWGPHKIDTGNAARIPVHSPQTNSRLYDEIRYLPGLAELARRGHLKLFTSAELRAEQSREPTGRFRGYGLFDQNLFAGLEPESVDGYQLDLGPDAQQSQLARVNACQDPLFLTLVSIWGQKNSLDAHHVCTAEKTGMYCFLHLDFPLAERVRQNRNKPPLNTLQTQILLPSLLGAKLGVLPVDTHLLSYRRASFPVRPDLSWPDKRRQRPARRKTDG